MEQLSIDERKVLNLYFDFFKHPDPTKKEGPRLALFA